MSTTTPTTPAVRPSLCQVCFHPGHCYRNCVHPSIEASHEQGIERYKRYMMSHTNYEHRASMENWRQRLSRGIMRALLVKYASPDILGDFASITEWRQWRISQALNVNIADHVYNPSLRIPSRAAIHGNGSKEELRFMIDILYVSLAKEVILTNVDYIETMSANDHASQLRDAFLIMRRQVNNPNISGEGLQHYAQDVIQYLQTIIQQQSIYTISSPVAVPEMQPTYLNAPLPRLFNVPIPHLFDAFDALDMDMDMDTAPIQQSHPRAPPRPPTFVIDVTRQASVPAPDDNAPAEIIQCGICWDEMNDESMLTTNCNHNFCNGCITSQLSTIRNKHQTRQRYLDLSCALCRQNVETLSHKMDDNSTKLADLRNMLYHPVAVADAAFADTAPVNA